MTRRPKVTVMMKAANLPNARHRRVYRIPVVWGRGAIGRRCVVWVDLDEEVVVGCCVRRGRYELEWDGGDFVPAAVAREIGRQVKRWLRKHRRKVPDHVSVWQAVCVDRGVA